MKCLQCNADLINRSQKKFCSRSCSAKYNNRGINRHGTDVKIGNCLYCGTKLDRVNKIYCNTVCQGQYTFESKTVPRILKGKVHKSQRLKRYLESRFGNCCQICGIGNQWNGQDLVLQVDHIDGNHKNNLPENLRLICPNCHSQTETFSRNTNDGVSDERLLLALNQTDNIKQALESVNLRVCGGSYKRCYNLLNKC